MAGSIEFPGQAQFYSFQAQGGDAVFIVLVEGNDIDGMILELIDPQGSSVRGASYSGSSTIDTQLESAGKYTIRVRGGVKAGSYSLSFNHRPQGSGIPLPQIYSALGEITFPAEVHWYTFEAQAGDAVSVVLVEGGDMRFMMLELFDPQGSLFYGTNSAAASKTATINEQVVTPGKYAIRVRHRTLKTGSYTLSFNKIP